MAGGAAIGVGAAGVAHAYATTRLDDIHRAMPFDAPPSLAPDEVYAVSAYVLHLNGSCPRMPGSMPPRFPRW